MIDRQKLLADLKPILKEVEADLRARCDEVPQIDADLKREYEQARAADRTGVTYEEWRADLITQVAVAWVLSCVFVRFLEDNALIAPPRISGSLHGAGADAGLMRARDERETYFKTHAKQTDREYLLAVFDDLAKLSGTKDVFGAHNVALAYRNWLSGDAAQKLIEFFQKIDTDGTGELIHDFSDANWDTRFLGDLYQDLSEAARKKYALLQTPIFVEEFILERTLEPAIKEFGLKDFKMIDPACGSGHFLLGGFARILKHWRTKEPGTNVREQVNRALAAVHGVDLNPYAIAIARFRLLVAAMRECHITKLKDAPAFAFNLVCGDSLLHGTPGTEQQFLGFHALAHAYQSEDLPELQRILRPGCYHAVVANPPYITVKDRMLNAAYRDRYPSVCHMKYSLSAPFMQRLFDLACRDGFVGQITANSFMNNEFGRKLVQQFFPKVDLTHVVDTRFAKIPGHETPTAILFGRMRKPVATTVRAVMGIKGERTAPADAANGAVWLSICEMIDRAGASNEYFSVVDAPRETFYVHPWNIGGGGVAELKDRIDAAGTALIEHIDRTGIGVVTLEDDAYTRPVPTLHRQNIADAYAIVLVEGDAVREWRLDTSESALFPYSSSNFAPEITPAGSRALWGFRTGLKQRLWFGSTQEERGMWWYEYGMLSRELIAEQNLIVCAYKATHNHYVLVGSRSLFKQTAPVIKLRAAAPQQEFHRLLAVLNSSVCAFWERAMHRAVAGEGEEQWEVRLERNSTKLVRFPVSHAAPTGTAGALCALAQTCDAAAPAAVAKRVVPTNDHLREAREISQQAICRMIALQEEMDWQCYRSYGLLDDSPQCEDPPPIVLGQRAFEIVLARKMAAGEEETTWFARHGSTPITAIPKHWPEKYQRIVQRRIEIIESDTNISLIERPEHKRRWNLPPWDQEQDRALRDWLLDRLESYFDLDGRMNDRNEATARSELHEPRLTSAARVGDMARVDKEFMQVAEILAGRMDFDVGALVSQLVAVESVPALPVMRYKPTGMDKRRAWERTWELQRIEDAVDALFEVERLKKMAAGKAEEVLRPFVAALRIDEPAKPHVLREAVTAAGYVMEALKQKLDLASDTILKPVYENARRARKAAVGDIPVPPKYTNADFLSGDVWRLRGKLDVPKERWVSFPNCEGEDGTLVIAWAGYNHLQLARAIAERYELAKEQEGRKLVPLLAAIGELIPWLKQWHNEPDMAFGGTRMGNYFEEHLAQEAKALGMSVEQVMAWTPPEKASKARKAKKMKPADGETLGPRT